MSITLIRPALRRAAVTRIWPRAVHSSNIHKITRASVSLPSPLRRRLQPFSTSSTAYNVPIASSSPPPEDSEPVPKLQLTFTCTADITPDGKSTPGLEAAGEGIEPTICSHRSTHTFTKNAYNKGIVIIQCPGCKNRHLIADNLGWFKNQDDSEGGKTVEDFVRANGEAVRRGKLVQGPNGDVEYVE